jgi:hypothetical protein
LGLIQFSFGKSDALAKLGHSLTHLSNHSRAMGHPLFGASHANQGCTFDAEYQLLEGVWFRWSVIAQQPQPALWR